MVPHLRTLSEINPENSVSQNELSLYKGDLTPIIVLREIARAKAAFPALPNTFFDILRDRINANKFSDERFTDSVNNVIDTCPYPTPTIANFISFDKRIKINSYEEMMKKASEFGPEIWKSYRMVKFPEREKPVWVHIDDMKAAKLTEYIPGK